MNIKPREILINRFIGQTYYNNFFKPKILKESRRWKNSWNKKIACLILSYDIDETADIELLPKLLKLLKKYNIKASFAVIGKLAQKNPEIFDKLIDEGHELINHTQTHPDNIEFNPNKHFHTITKNERFKEIKDCHKTVKKLFDYDMYGFRVPHFGYQYVPDIYDSLKKLEYDFSSSRVAIDTHTAGYPYKVDNIWEYPLICCPKHPYCIFDTAHAFRSRFARHSPQDYIETFQKLISEGIKHHMFINLYQDPQDIEKFEYEELLKIIIKHKKDLWITTYDTLTEHLNEIKK